MKAKYVNPFTDFGFKKIFGTEASKPMLIDFLNSLLPQCDIQELTFKDKEHPGKSEADRKAVYDIYCQLGNGERIIIELQKAKQKYFKDRTIYYASFPIQEQAEKGEWDYELKAVFCIGILDFKFDIDGNKTEEVVHTVKLKDQHNQLFYDKLTFIYLEMPHFNKKENQLDTRLDKWLYFIRHLEDFQSIPEIFKDAIFSEAFGKAEIANFNDQERNEYETSLKIFRDYNNTLYTAFDQGKIEGEIMGEIRGEIKGEMKGIVKGERKKEIEIVIKGWKMGLDFTDLSKLTGLSVEEINEIILIFKEDE